MNTTNAQAREQAPRDVAVIGGGISGLSAAHRIHELAPHLRVTVFESTGRLGGVLKTTQGDGFLIEESADMFTTLQPWALELCRRLGQESQMIEPNAEHRRAFVVKNGRLWPIPDGLSLLGPSRIWPLITTRLLGLGGKLRMVGEMFVGRRQSQDDESLAEFARRRLGKQAYDWLIQPLVGGIYTADPEKLSMQATLPQFVEMERLHGSLIRGMRKSQRNRQADRQASGARYGTFRAPRLGMSSLVDALAVRIPSTFRRSTEICRIERVAGDEANETDRWQLSTADGQVWRGAGVVVATPAAISARLLDDVAAPLAAQLSEIPLAGVVIAVFGMRLSQVGRAVDGFGFVVPLRANRRILAGSFASIKFAGRAPDGQLLIRVFVGGACQPHLMEMDDDEIGKMVWSELEDLIQLRGQPTLRQIVRWNNVMPQYHLGHTQRVDSIDKQVAGLPGLELAGNAYRGVGIPFCVRSGEQAAERLLRYLTDDHGTN